MLLAWAGRYTVEGLRVLGDAQGALTGLLRMTAKGLLNHIAREITLRRALCGWRCRLGHPHSKANTVADTLSRMHGPDAPELPPSCGAALHLATPDWESAWRVLLWSPPPGVPRRPGAGRRRLGREDAVRVQ